MRQGILRTLDQRRVRLFFNLSSCLNLSPVGKVVGFSALCHLFRAICLLACWVMDLSQIALEIDKGTSRVGWNYLPTRSRSLPLLVMALFLFAIWRHPTIGISRPRCIRRTLNWLSLFCPESGNATISTLTSSCDGSAPMFSLCCHIEVVYGNWPTLLLKNFKLSSTHFYPMFSMSIYNNWKIWMM